METLVRRLESLLSVGAVRQLVELIGDRTDATVSVQDLDGNLLWATAPGSEAMYHRSLEEFAGVHALDFIHPQDAASYARSLERAYDGQTVHWQGRASTGDGQWIDVISVSWVAEDRDHEQVLVAVSRQSG